MAGGLSLPEFPDAVMYCMYSSLGFATGHSHMRR